MSDAVILKSNKYGLTMQLDPSVPFEDLIRAICEKFAASRDFFGHTSMILETYGRDLSFEESNFVIQAIELNSDIKIILINEKSELKDVRMMDSIDRFYTDNIFETAKIYRGSITKEQKISSDTSIIVLGDVKSKAAVRAKGNIIVYGALEGEAYAGYPDNTGCYIAAGTLDSSNLQIGTCKGQVKVQDKWSFRVRKSVNEPIGVMVFNGELLAEPLSTGLLKKVR